VIPNYRQVFRVLMVFSSFQSRFSADISKIGWVDDLVVEEL